jgi:HlyD family secretion protein
MKTKLIFRLPNHLEPAAIFAALTFSICLAAGCSSTPKEKEPVVPVQVTPAEQGPISQIINAEAVVFPLQQASVAPKITSPVKQFLVQRGAKVQKGQLLAILENADLSAAAAASKSDFDQAQATYETTVGAGLPQQIQKAELDAAAAKSAFEAAQKVYNSRKDLFAQGAIPRRDLDTAEVALVQARSQNDQAQKALVDFQRLGKQQALKSAEAQKGSARGKLQGAEAQLSYSQIRSPMNGVVTDRPLNVGDTAQANQPMLTVMDTSKLIAKAHIPQSDAAQLKVGNPAKIIITGVDEPIDGKVTLVSPALDPGSTTIEVWVEAKKRDPNLRPGISVQLEMTAKTVKDAVIAPAAAVFKSAEGADYVLVAGSDEKAHQKTVKTGIRAKEDVQILSGIKAGDPIITTGGYGLPDATTIKIEKPGEGEKEGAAADDKKDDEKKGDAKDDEDKAKDSKDTKKGAAAKPDEKEKE